MHFTISISIVLMCEVPKEEEPTAYVWRDKHLSIAYDCIGKQLTTVLVC